ncbi:MAG: Ig-like domain repeat protein [Planctomycetia bacterium]|nr:Ig-like domain repeat protein [Planctomycetia bacterium]
MGALPAGFQVIVADYNGDGEYTKGLDALTVIFVGAAGNPPDVGEVDLSSSDSSSAYTQEVTFTATVEAANPLDPPPAGQIAFYTGATLLGTAALNSNGVATWNVSNLGVGSHPISAHFISEVYPGQDWSATLTQTVSANSTTVSLTGPATSYHTDEVTFTVTVTASGTPIPDIPSGDVEFYADGEYLGSTELDAMGTATFQLVGSGRGTWTITAVYSGDGVFIGGSNSSLAHMVFNNAPELTDDATTTRADESVKVFVLDNDFDADFDELTVTGWSQPQNGSVVLTPDGFLYTPNPGFIGTNTFTYTVDDGSGGVTTATATVRVLAPTANNRAFADVNGNGVQDPGEPGLRNVRVELLDSAGNVVRSATTDNNGFYFFDPAPAGTYRVRFVLPDWQPPLPFSPKHMGDPTRDSDVDPAGYSDFCFYDPMQPTDIAAGIILDPDDPLLSYLIR